MEKRYCIVLCHWWQFYKAACTPLRIYIISI